MKQNKIKDSTTVEKAMAPLMQKLAQIAPVAPVPPMPPVPSQPSAQPMPAKPLPKYCEHHAQWHEGEEYQLTNDGGECVDCVNNNEAKYDQPDPDILPVGAAPMNYLAWVKKHCKFAQMMPQQPQQQQQQQQQGDVRQTVVMELAQKLVPMSLKFPIADHDVRQGIIKMLREKGLGMPQAQEIESFVADVKDAIVGSGGKIAAPNQAAQPQAPDAKMWDPRSQQRQQNAPMDPQMQNWYNNQPQKGMAPAAPAQAPISAPQRSTRKPFEG